MLKKKERLSRKEFDRSFAHGKRIHSPFVQLIYEKSEAFHGSVVVGKKIAKRAVDRNKLRRRIYGVLYDTFKKTGKQMTIILIAKSGILAVPRKALALEIKGLLERLP